MLINTHACSSVLVGLKIIIIIIVIDPKCEQFLVNLVHWPSVGGSTGIILTKLCKMFVFRHSSNISTSVAKISLFPMLIMHQK